ncbi:MAG: DegT/DnrJ/EryC1/StrS family aminotransferase [Ilumatobacteraceae bacterium]
MTIPITRPVLGDSELAAIAAVLDSGHLVQGSRVTEFERLVAEHVGSSHAVAVSNCTAALRVSLLALGIGPGDRVVVAPYSWVATANVIELCGATPVFVDIDPATFNMDAELLRVKLDELSSAGGISTVKAIMPVHTFGNPAGISDLETVAAEHMIPIVEDAACALGAHEDGRPAGSFGAIGCFSFHPRKIITTGEGGMIVTNDDGVADFARTFRNHGQRVVDGSAEFVMPGDNLRLTDLQGAIGVAQMGRLFGLVADRTRLADRYDTLLTPLHFEPQHRGKGAAVQSYVVLCPPAVLASEVIAALRSRGVEATVGTNAIPFTRFYSERYGIAEHDLPATVEVARRAVTLPLYPQMTEADQDEVVQLITEIVQVVAR